MRRFQTSGLILAYHGIVILLIVLIDQVQWDHLISTQAFLGFDAAHYASIAAHGYEGFRVAFFPLFPILWRVSALGVAGIVCFNACLYFASLLLLNNLLRPEWRTILVWISLPSAIFYFLPYSEAVFFAAATLLIIATNKRNLPLTCLAFFICTLSRPVFSVLLPAMFLTELFIEPNWRKLGVRCLLYSLSSALGMLVVALIQHHDTGEWFGWYASQKGWGNALRLPKLPLTSWGGNHAVRLDAVAFLLGLISATYLSFLGLKRFRKNASPSIDPAIILSAGYVAGIAMLTLFFRGGELFSLNRFVFATPFVLVLIDHYIKRMGPFTTKHFAIGFVILSCYFLLFGSYGHIQTFLKFAALTLYLLMFGLMPLSNPRARNWSLPIWLIIAIILQIFYFYTFISGGWVA